MGQFSTDATINVGEGWGHAGGSNKGISVQGSGALKIVTMEVK